MTAQAGALNCDSISTGVGRTISSQHLRFVARLATLIVVALLSAAQALPAQRVHEDSFYPAWASDARYLQSLTVLDTDSALGRRNLHPKRITLKDMARMHGHLCDGLATAWVELGQALRAMFPDGIVDRTDVRVVSKNAPCWADAGAWMTGARINQGTLVLDNSVGDGFIVQRISTGKAVRVSLRPGMYPAELAALEQSIRSRRAHGDAVAPSDIDRFERGADQYILKLLNTPPDQAVTVEELAGFEFPDHSKNPLAPRSDIINRDVLRSDLRTSDATK
ncbi:MAG TPA: formylmethanofuran dehydrogenase subunit E family protein [Edaphobacter sp.]|uniref:formylmethanofuran dehydrogenase subunit E family protein n=1 Tax=Edaphobacter sp. TaxID=1934404 RepID=UPI002D04A0A5|nr:formylmethanofuran dehydrogenase subunit E family protein [Edaphobacter sp.]HUZ95001.1 formylmethanofuran dehydrogenase subunit E family protein [Edaphobacter sp.]